MLRKAVLAGLAAASLSASPAPPRNLPSVELAEKGDQWSATYSLAAPATKLYFTQKIGAGRRAAQWTTDDDFEIASEDGRDYFHRKDGKTFRTAQVQAPAVFGESSGDYAPFVNFSDNSRLVYTSKFLTCADQCPPDPVWKLRARTGPGEVAILDGRVRRGKISWDERRRGRYLFLGHIVLAEDRNFIAVIDPGLPAAVRRSLADSFPSFMDFFSARLGALEQKPTLFVSYEPHYSAGTGTKGGTLPNQVFMHLYGPSIIKDYGLWRVTWYFAHEASHLFQRKGQVGGADSWIHEGAAEMFAALALRGASPEAANYVQSRLTEARRECGDALKQISLHDAAKLGKSDLYYPCGLLLQERFDRKIRENQPGKDGLFTLWRDYEDRIGKGATAGPETYLAAVEALAGAETASWARHIINDRLTDPAAALGQGTK